MKRTTPALSARDLLVLRALRPGPLDRASLARECRRTELTLQPALQSLLRRELIKMQLGFEADGTRRLYRLSARGRRAVLEGR